MCPNVKSFVFLVNDYVKLGEGAMLELKESSEAELSWATSRNIHACWYSSVYTSE
jgi:hypothetical protein